MAKGKINLRNELRAYKFEFDLLQKIPCTKKENKEFEKLLSDGGTLPEGVYPYIYDDGQESTTAFYTVYEPDLTEAEKNEYLTYRKLSMINTIKSCIFFLTVLTVLGMVASLLIAMNFFNW